MELVSILVDQSYPTWNQMKRLYKRSFPQKERLPFCVLKRSICSPLVIWYAYYDRGCFVGFAYLVADSSLAYLFYLAVDETVRSKGYGSAILADIASKFSQPIVLDMEECDAHAKNFKQRLRRKTFYERNGFVSAGFKAAYNGVRYESWIRGTNFEKDKLLALFKRYRREVLGKRK